MSGVLHLVGLLHAVAERDAGVRYSCSPLVAGGYCYGDRTTGQPNTCDSGVDPASCAACCETRGVAGCCEWSEGTVSGTVSLPTESVTVSSSLPSATATVTVPSSTVTATVTLATETASGTATLPTATATLSLPTASGTVSGSGTATLPSVSATASDTGSATMSLPSASLSDTLSLPTATATMPSRTESPTVTASMPTATATVSLPTTSASDSATLPTADLTATKQANVSAFGGYTGSCYFFVDGKSSGGGGYSRAQSCVALTSTETKSPTPSASPSATVPVADAACTGSSVYPTEAAAGVNFTVTVFCRRGVSGESLFFTQTVGYCDDREAVLLGPAGDSVYAALQYRDQAKHPVAVVPAIYEPARYQVCLQTVDGGSEPLGPLFDVLPPRPKEFVWLQNGAGADTAFRLTVDGVGLSGLQFAVSTDQTCSTRVRETARVGEFIDGVTADGPIRVGPGSYVGTRWTGWLHPGDPRLVQEDTAGLSQPLRRSDGMLVHAEDPFGGYDVTEDGTLAVTTLTLAEGTYYHCYRRFEDEEWSAHAKFLVPKIELRRAAPTPAHLTTGQPFYLTLFGPGIANLTSESCRIAVLGDVCTSSSDVADSVEVVDDTLVCYFKTGATSSGWHHACIGSYNGTESYRNTAAERGDYERTPGGATFIVWAPSYPLAEVSPTEPATREWFTVALEGGEFEAGSYVKLVDGQNCRSANHTEDQAEVQVADWTGPMVFVKYNGDPCATAGGWSGHLERGLTLMSTTDSDIEPDRLFHLCPAGQVTTGTAMVLCDHFTASRLYPGTVRVDDNVACGLLGGRWWADGRSRCDVALCAATLDSNCPGPGCGVSGGLSVQGYGHCLGYRTTVAAFVATADACESYHGRWGDGSCWMEVCTASDLPVNWHPQGYPTPTPTRYYVPRRVSEPFMLRRSAYPVHVCGKRQGAADWVWLGAFGVADSCRVARAKACRRIACGSGSLALQQGTGAGEYNPGPCAALGAEGGEEDARGIGRPKGQEGDPDLGSWEPIGTRATRLGRPIAPSAVQGPVTWNKRLHGPSAALQRVCAAFACADAPGGDRVGRVGDPAPARFGGAWPRLRYRWFVPSPDGLQARLLLPPYRTEPEAGTELHLSTRRPLDLDPFGETPVGFSFTGIYPSTLRMGLLSNSSLYDGADSGRFYNDSATPLKFEVSFSSTSSPCSLSQDTKYRAVFRLRPTPELAIWIDDQGGLACYMRPMTDLTELADEGWRLTFVLTWPSSSSLKPSSWGDARVSLHP